MPNSAVPENTVPSSAVQNSAAAEEDIESGSRGAALGGVTSFFEMPNTVPATTTQEHFEDKIHRAQNRSWVNFAFYIGGSPENVQNLRSLEKLPACPGVKVFMGSSTGSLLVEDDPTMTKILQGTARRVTVHSEDEFRLRERKHIATDSHDVRNHPVWRDAETALSCTRRLLNLAKLTNRKVHILHISSAEEIALIRMNKNFATAEILPQHLTLFAPDCYERFGTRAQQNPPIREKHHQDALWAAVKDGTFDVMGSDHAPHTLEEKFKPYPTSPSGMPMVQTTVPLMLNFVNQGK